MLNRFWIVSTLSLVSLISLKGVMEHLIDKYPRPPITFTPRSAESYGLGLKTYSFGFDNVMASTLWIDLLQKARHQHSGTDRLSWEFVQLDAINRLDPWFERAYSFGGVVLSVLVQDKEGARRILRRWSMRRPRNWNVHYLYGYHLFFELKEFANASYHILRAAELEGAPSWLNSLAVRLLSETGALAESLRLCLLLYDQVVDTEGRDRLAIRIRSLNFNLQRKAWEAALEEFRAREGTEPRVVGDLNRYFQPRLREVASSISGGGVPTEVTVLLSERFPFRYDRNTRMILADLPTGKIGPDEVGIFQVK